LAVTISIVQYRHTHVRPIGGVHMVAVCLDVLPTIICRKQTHGIQ